jgi:quercetin dioxygenase-like cupin family protein
MPNDTLYYNTIIWSEHHNQGSGMFEINGVQHEVSPGTFLHLAPTERHGIWVPKENEDPLKMLVTGVVVGEKK